MIGVIESSWLWRGVAWLGVLSTVLWLVTRLFPVPSRPREREPWLDERENEERENTARSEQAGAAPIREVKKEALASAAMNDVNEGSLHEEEDRTNTRNRPYRPGS